MELKQIKELMAAMGRTGTKRLSIKKEGFELELEQEERSSQRPEQTFDFEESLYRMENSPKRDLAFAKTDKIPAPLAEINAKEDAPGSYVTSPMVGTFYAAPSPEDLPFAKVGDKVTKKTVLCIIEAMKVMNEITAGVDGTLAEICVDSGHPVEFGTKLFRIT